MSEESTKWDKQWGILLTRCHGADVEAKAEFKSSLLDELKRKTAENHDAGADTDAAQDANWSKLLVHAYPPCHPDTEFRSQLLGKLKSKQMNEFGEAATATTEVAKTDEDEAIRSVLSKSYQPVAPRREFQTRLLVNLKERQRHTAVIRRKSRRRTFVMSTASSIAAAAMVIFVVWMVPHGDTMSRSESKGALKLSIPETAAMDYPVADSAPGFSSDVAFADTIVTDAQASGFSIVPASFSGYRVSDAFAGSALPQAAYARSEMEVFNGSEWQRLGKDDSAQLSPGMAFRSADDMGHMQFPDGSIVSISPDSLVNVTPAGLSVEEGFMLVSVPEQVKDSFRLHFPERDIAVAPGTDLAIMVAPASLYAEGGAPAPMVMVVDREDSPGGFALAKGKAGVGPLLAKQLYRLDNYVTAALPSRTMCDTECQDLSNMLTTKTWLNSRLMGSFAGYGGNSLGGGTVDSYTTLISPAGYSRKGDRWLADSYSGQETTKIKYLSDTYFGLANERRDLALALALGSNIVVDGGNDVFYEIVK